MFQRKISKIFKELPNMFRIADDILVVGYDNDSRNHDNMLWRVLLTCREINLKLNNSVISGVHQFIFFLMRSFPEMV